MLFTHLLRVALRVIDGDTIKVRIGEQVRTVRLIGVDTPETKHPTKAVQYFGREASAFTKAHSKAKRYGLKRTAPGIRATATDACCGTSMSMARISMPPSSERAMLTFIGAFPSLKGRSLFTLKNRLESKEKACGERR